VGELEREAVEHLRALIRFDTSNPPGNEGPAAEYVAAVGRAAGLEAQVLEAEPGRGNAVLRLRGSGQGPADGRSAPPILLLSHLDTVPAEPDRWTYSPWAAEVADGCVWGRGAIDSKLTTATQLAALVALAREGAPPRRDVVLAATAAEEGGGPANGAAWLADNRPDLVAADYTLNEHGGFCVEVGGRRYYTLQVAEKGGCAASLVARGAPGQASVPHADNAIYKLGRAIARLSAGEMPLRVTATARAFVEAMADDHRRHGSAAVAAQLLALLDASTHDAARRDLPASQGLRDMLGAILHNTAAPTILQGGIKSNVIPSEVAVHLSGRPLPGVTPAEFAAELRAIVGDEAASRPEGLDVVVPPESFSPGLAHARDEVFEAAALRALRRHDPEAVLVPLMMPLGTDAKRMVHLNSRIYGFVPMVLEPELDYMSLCHGHDERASLRQIGFGARVIHDLVRDLAW
jgi:acetylornithine deacetylase/succinyl-diaminopimelate desuccinylase-like protein